MKVFRGSGNNPEQSGTLLKTSVGTWLRCAHKMEEKLNKDRKKEGGVWAHDTMKAK